MAITTSILTAGTNGHQTTSEEANRFVTNFITPGIVGAFTANTGSGGTGSYSVNAAGTPNKTVLIGTGDIVLAVTPATQALQNLTARNDAVITYTHSDNGTSGTVYDWIYVAADSTKANNPNTAGTDVSSIVVNRSTLLASDTVGAPANSQVIAVVTLTVGFTSIPNSAITDKRTASSAAILPGSIGTTQLATGAVTGTKLATMRTTNTTTDQVLDIGDVRIIMGRRVWSAQGTSGWFNQTVTFSNSGFADTNYVVTVGTAHSFNVEYNAHGASAGFLGTGDGTMTATTFTVRTFAANTGNGGAFSFIATGKKP